MLGPVSQRLNPLLPLRSSPSFFPPPTADPNKVHFFHIAIMTGLLISSTAHFHIYFPKDSSRTYPAFAAKRDGSTTRDSIFVVLGRITAVQVSNALLSTSLVISVFPNWKFISFSHRISSSVEYVFSATDLDKSHLFLNSGYSNDTRRRNWIASQDRRLSPSWDATQIRRLTSVE